MKKFETQAIPQAQEPGNVSPRLLLEKTDCEHWSSIASRATDPVVAHLIVKVLDEDPVLRSRRIGVYLTARTTVQHDRIRYAKLCRRREAMEKVGEIAMAAGRVLYRLSSVACQRFRARRSPVGSSATLPANANHVEPAVETTPFDVLVNEAHLASQMNSAISASVH